MTTGLVGSEMCIRDSTHTHTLIHKRKTNQPTTKTKKQPYTRTRTISLSLVIATKPIKFHYRPFLLRLSAPVVLELGERRGSEQSIINGAINKILTLSKEPNGLLRVHQRTVRTWRRLSGSLCLPLSRPQQNRWSQSWAKRTEHVCMVPGGVFFLFSTAFLFLMPHCHRDITEYI